MAAAFDDSDLSMPLPAYDPDRSGRRDSHSQSHSHSHPHAHPVMAHRPNRPVDPTTYSPSTQRDMQRLDQYQTVRILGEGSFGKVKLAVHRASGRQVALKVIPRRKLLSRDMVGRVEREIQYLQLLRHPHIIKL
jgi:carbon catabolite-derepressing protein kinase